MVRGDRESPQECNQKNLTMRKEDASHEVVHPPEVHDIYLTSWNSRMGVGNERLTPTEDMKKVQNRTFRGPASFSMMCRSTWKSSPK